MLVVVMLVVVMLVVVMLVVVMLVVVMLVVVMLAVGVFVVIVAHHSLLAVLTLARLPWSAATSAAPASRFW